MDNASYHSTSTAPLLRSKKADLHAWLETQTDKLRQPLPALANTRLWDLRDMVRFFYLWGINFPYEIVLHILSQVRTLKQKNNYFKVEEIAKANDVTILRLPPWNCELNPIELCWNDVKREVKEKNINLNTQQLQDLTINVLTNYRNNTQWPSHLEHVRKYVSICLAIDVSLQLQAWLIFTIDYAKVTGLMTDGMNIFLKILT